MDWNNINRDRDTSGLGPIEYDQSKVPALIRKHADNVRTKTYGQEVREAQARNAEYAGLIASESMSIANNANILSKDTQNRFKDQIEGTTNSDEVIEARRPFGTETPFKTIGERLDYADKITTEVYINVRLFGAIGDGIANDTQSIQKAIDFAPRNSTIYFPAGEYLVDAEKDKQLKLKSNINIELNPFATIKVIPNANTNYELFLLSNVENVYIKGGTLKGDKEEHLGTTGEWGHGFKLEFTKNVNVENVNIEDFWGDGISFGGKTYEGRPIDTYLKDVYIKNCRRQGISVTNADGLYGQNIHISDIAGTMPESGIDFEPDHSSGVLKNIHLRNVYINGTASSAVLFVPMQQSKEENTTEWDINIHNLVVDNCLNAVYFYQPSVASIFPVKGKININGIKSTNTGNSVVGAQEWVNVLPEIEINDIDSDGAGLDGAQGADSSVAILVRTRGSKPGQKIRLNNVKLKNTTGREMHIVGSKGYPVNVDVDIISSEKNSLVNFNKGEIVSKSKYTTTTLSNQRIFFEKTLFQNFTADNVPVLELPSASELINRRAEIDIQVNHNTAQESTANILSIARNETVEYDPIFFKNSNGSFTRSVDRKVFIRNRYSKLTIESNGSAWFIYGTAEIVD